MTSAQLLHVVCGVCGEATGDYTKTAIQVTVKSGELRIRTWLCLDCMTKADDAQEASPFLQRFDGPGEDVTGLEANRR